MSSDVEEPERKPRGISTEDCQRMVDRAITRDPTVKFLLEKLDEVSMLPFLHNIPTIPFLSTNEPCMQADSRHMHCSMPAEGHIL